MQKFKNKREEFNYYVLKSEWYKKNGDVFNERLYFEKAKKIKEELDREERR